MGNMSLQSHRGPDEQLLHQWPIACLCNGWRTTTQRWQRSGTETPTAAGRQRLWRAAATAQNSPAAWRCHCCGNRWNSTTNINQNPAQKGMPRQVLGCLGRHATHS
eukprot:jgi/Astpho2/7675/Aster-02557